MSVVITQLYLHQHLGKVVICGDFNSRCGASPDNVEGVDTVPERHVVDEKNDSNGEYFLKFLMDSSCCMLSGRHNIGNNFTCISTRGRSVIDYCIVQHDQIEHFSQMNVMTMNDLLQQTFLPGVVDPSQSVPDYSLLCWQIKLVSSFIGTNN